MKWLLSKLYELAVRIHNPGVSAIKSRIPVISVGNIEVGGTGKSPIAQATCQALIGRGKRPAIFSRGYGGSLKGPVRVDPSLHDYTQVGDEPLMHALAGFDVYICGDRAKAIELAFHDGIEIAVLDDGHATKSVQKGFSILVFRPGFAARPALLPLGRLREPLLRGLARADFVIVNGELDDQDQALIAQTGLDHLVGEFQVSPAIFEQDYVLVTSVANPDRVYESAVKVGWKISQHMKFSDHHKFSADDWDHVRAQSQPILMTAKDAVKAPKGLDYQVLQGGWYPRNSADFEAMIDRALSSRRDQ